MCKCQTLILHTFFSQDIDRIMLLHGTRVMESVKPILDSETRTEDVKEQVNTSNEARVLEYNLSHTLVYLVVLFKPG